MMLPCSTPDCHAMANPARRYCDACDVLGMPENWSRTRDAAWLAGKTTSEIEAIPLPDRNKRLVLVRGEEMHVPTRERNGQA